MSNNVPRAVFQEHERQCLQRHATPSTCSRAVHRKFPQKEDDFRTPFQRDYTRIIHSRAFRRLHHKTQVFISPNNDHLCTRMEHSLHVASVAQTIARALRLNEDLVRAIAVGHDLGHAPFGHKGEETLRSIVKDAGLTFYHELHSLRVVDFLESPYDAHNGLNLTFAVRDGIVCHFGEGFEKELSPAREKTPDDLANTVRGKSKPATLEGCVVRWADKVAYLGRDFEDALSVGLVKRRADLPGSVKKTLGKTNRKIINSLVGELCRTTNGNDNRIRVGDEVHSALNDLYAFNMDKIYRSPEVTKHFGQIDRAMESLFDYLLKFLAKAKSERDLLGSAWETLQIFGDFLNNDVRSWRNEAREQLVLDFVAGMTDSFFNKSFSDLFWPRSTF